MGSICLWASFSESLSGQEGAGCWQKHPHSHTECLHNCLYPVTLTAIYKSRTHMQLFVSCDLHVHIHMHGDVG